MKTIDEVLALRSVKERRIEFYGLICELEAKEEWSTAKEHILNHSDAMNGRGTKWTAIAKRFEAREKKNWNEHYGGKSVLDWILDAHWLI